jgi:FKBP-type peptidyl-prolyl cis-trans isomerase
MTRTSKLFPALFA